MLNVKCWIPSVCIMCAAGQVLVGNWNTARSLMLVFQNLKTEQPPNYLCKDVKVDLERKWPSYIYLFAHDDVYISNLKRLLLCRNRRFSE